MVAQRTDSRVAVSLQLEDAVGDCGHHVVELLLSALPGFDQGAPGRRIPQTPLRHIPRKLLVIWDGLPSHRSLMVRDFVAEQNGRLQLERLPAYAPELNPVEYIWGYWKQHELPNFCPKDYAQLSYQARAALRRMRRRPTLIQSLWKQAELF